MTIDELERSLRAAGRAPAPEPRAAFADTLEDRLRAGIVLACLPEAPSVARRRVHAFPLAVVAAAAALAAVFGVTTLVNRGVLREVRVATASDALAVLPDGTVDGMAVGEVMPDGTRIVTGEEGRVVAGNVEIGPNQEAVVSGGEMRPSPPPAPPTTVPAPPSSPPATKPKPNSPKPSSPPATVNSKPSVEPAPPSPAVEPAGPGPAAPPTTASGRQYRPKDTTTTTAAAPTAATPQPAPADMKLAAWFKDKLVYLTWTSYPGPDFAAYVVLRSDAPFEPRYPVDGHTSVIARIQDPGTNHAFDNVDQPDGALYRIVAVDKQRRPLAQSPAVQPQAVSSQQKTTR